MVQQLITLLAVHIFKLLTLSKIFGLRRVKAKTPINADNNNPTAKDKGVFEARLIDWCIIRIGIIRLEQMAMIKNANE